jgi:hypothetical protein
MVFKRAHSSGYWTCYRLLQTNGTTEQENDPMSLNTLLIIIVVVLLLGGGGLYFR